MGLGDRDQIAGDFPGGKQAQLFAPLLVHAAAGQICPPPGAALGNGRKTRSAGRGFKLGQGRIRINVEIGRKPGPCLVDISCHNALSPLPICALP